MNSYELCNDSEVYSITIPPGAFVMDVLLMFEINYSLQMREGAECGRSPWLRVREGDLKILTARETSVMNISLSFAMI